MMFRCVPAADPPARPVPGDIWIDSERKSVRAFDGATDVAILEFETVEAALAGREFLRRFWRSTPQERDVILSILTGGTT